MKNKFYSIILCLALSINISCNTNLENGGFVLNKETNSSNRFRLDGYYYSLTQGPILFTYVFYGNGQVLDCIVDWNALYDFEYNIANGEINSIVKDYRRAWGRYLLNDSNIQMEFPYDFSQFTNLRTGVVLNDTTLLFLTITNTEHKRIDYLNDTLHFKAFSSKPDSTYVSTD